MDTKGLQKEFIAWCKSNKHSPKSEDETKLLFHKFMLEKHPEEYKAAMENQKKQQQQLAKKAAHGAKLNYFKSLKNQCAEDEEVVYYKKGGSVTCGCKKKMEEGGQTPKNKNNAIDKFKNRKQDLATKDSIAVNNYGAEDIEATRPGTYKKNKEGKVQWTPDRTKAPYNKTPKKACGSKIKKHQEGSVIAKFKAYRKGGSLNGIPFMQKGTSKEGIKRGINGEYYYNPIPKGAGERVGTFPLIDLYRAIEEKSKTTNNPYIQTGIVNSPVGPGGPVKKLISLGKPFKTVNGINYYKNAAGELRTALEMAKELAAIKNAKPRSWFPKEHHTDHYVPKNATGIYNELEKATYEGEQMMRDPFMNWKDFDEMNSVNYWKRGGFIKK